MAGRLPIYYNSFPFPDRRKGARESFHPAVRRVGGVPGYPIGGGPLITYSLRVAQHRADAKRANGLGDWTRMALGLCRKMPVAGGFGIAQVFSS